MTNTEAQQVLSAFMFRCGLEGMEMTDAELEAMTMAGNALETAPEWIPVTDRLPNDDEKKLVTAQTKKGIRSINIAYYDVYGWHGSGSMSGVTAWMEMPEPYEEVDDADE